MVNTLQPNLQVFEMWKKTGVLHCLVHFVSVVHILPLFRFLSLVRQTHHPRVHLECLDAPSLLPKPSGLLHLQRQTLTCLSGPNRPGVK